MQVNEMNEVTKFALFSMLFGPVKHKSVHEYRTSSAICQQVYSDKMDSKLFAHAWEIYGYLLIIQRSEFNMPEVVCCHGNNNNNNNVIE